MIRRVPVVATLVVAVAVAAMIGLGFWQLDRRQEKAALIAQYKANVDAPYVPIQALQPVGERALFRRVSVTCPSVVGWRAAVGRTSAGVGGWRHVAICRLKEFGPGLAIDMGTSANSVPPAWSGGELRGRLTWMPTNQPLLMRLIGKVPPPRPMVVAEVPARGLQPTAQPNPETVPNNHLSYAVQWFLFAGIAMVIYVVALLRRARSVAPPPPSR